MSALIKLFLLSFGIFEIHKTDTNDRAVNNGVTMDAGKLKTKDIFLDHIGGLLDEMFLIVPRIVKPFKPKRKIEKALYEKQINYYFKNGVIENPGNFFTFPRRAPEHKIIREESYFDGTKQVISYLSGYEVTNPYFRDEYNSYEQNKTGYLIKWTHGIEGNKAVLCLHGFMLGDPNQAERMFKIEKMFNMGIDVALFIAPFHWRRAPDLKMNRGLFLQPDNVVMTCECFGQSMYDLHSAVLILKNSGAKEIGIIGASLGGYNAGLYISQKSEISFAALMVPAIDFSENFGPGSMKYSFEYDGELLIKMKILWRFHSPLNFYPKIPEDNILLIAQRGDKLCRFGLTRSLCEKWNLTNAHFLTGGHWLVFNDQRGRLWYDFLKDKRFI